MRVASDQLDQLLAEVAALEQADEGLGRIGQALHHILFALDFAFLHPAGQRFPQGVGQEADQDVGLHAVFLLVPDRADRQTAQFGGCFQ